MQKANWRRRVRIRGAKGPWLGGYLIGIAATVLATAGVILAGKGIHARRKGMEPEVMVGEE